MQIEKRKHGEVLIIKPLTEYLSTDFKNHVIGEIQSNEKHILLDFSFVQKINSTTLECLISIYKALEDKANIGIYGLNDQPLRLIKLSGIIKIIKIFKNEEEAINQINLKS